MPRRNKNGKYYVQKKRKISKALTISKVRPDSGKNAIKRFEPGLRNMVAKIRRYFQMFVFRKIGTLCAMGGHIFVKKNIFRDFST